MPAVPVGSLLDSARRSMPSAAASSRASAPPASSPRAQMKVVGVPARAEATAWLKPLPPGPVMYWPAMVAPVAGSSLQRQTWSTLKEPTTMTGFMEPLLRLDYGGGWPGRARGRPAAGRRSAEVRQYTGDGGGHEGGDGAAQHRAQAEARQVLAALRGQAADAADLDRDRAEVGEAAQRVGRDQRALAA